MPNLLPLLPFTGPVACVLALAALGLAAWAVARPGRVVHRLSAALADSQASAGLRHLAAGMEPMAARMAAIEIAVETLRAAADAAPLPPGVVHFCAFETEGPPLSFSVAFVNRQRDGVVVTSLYARDQVRVFSKAMTGGVASTDLSAEEEEAVALALAGGGARTLLSPATRPASRRRAAFGR